jgi:hypothetical protein
MTMGIRRQQEFVTATAALVENAVSLWLDPVDDVRQLGKYMLHRAAGTPAR